MPDNSWERVTRKHRAEKAAREGRAFHCSGKKPKKNRRKKKKPAEDKGECRICKRTRLLARGDICLNCHRFYKKRVHEVAERISPRT